MYGMGCEWGYLCMGHGDVMRIDVVVIIHGHICISFDAMRECKELDML
jgi:hypothetical protein